jgi:hypothetical protein
MVWSPLSPSWLDTLLLGEETVGDGLYCIWCLHTLALWVHCRIYSSEQEWLAPGVL